MNNETNAVSDAGAAFLTDSPDPDFEFEIQTRLGRIARATAALPGGDPVSQMLTELQRTLANCDISPIDEIPTLAPAGDLSSTAGA